LNIFKLGYTLDSLTKKGIAVAIRLGNIADGEDFFARETELSDLWTYLEGNHIVLTGPRRLGKSSLLKRLAEQACERGVLAKLIDVEGLDSAQAFVQALADAYPDATVSGFASAAGGKIANLFSGVRKASVSLPAGMGSGTVEWQAMPDEPWSKSARQLQLRLSEAPVLILIDEFSVFVEKLIGRDPREALLVLGWLRAWRQSSSTCRLVFSGSIGINSLLERHTLTTSMNDCYDFKLGPFRLDEACDMLLELARRHAWHIDRDTARHLCDRIGWRSPFYLSLLFDETRKAGRDRVLETGVSEQVLRDTDVDDAYDRLLAARSRFIHWHKRLARDLSEPELGFVLATLSHAAKARQALSRPQMLARLSKLEPVATRRVERLSCALLYLEEQGYLAYEGENLQFISFLLRDYWRRNHAT
jgi:hypothetical protein